MYQTPEQLIAMNKASLEAAVRFAGIALEGAERFMEVQLKAAKGALPTACNKPRHYPKSKTRSNSRK